MDGAKLIAYLVERLRVLEEIPTDSNILILLRSLEKLDLEMIVNLGIHFTWDGEAKNFLLIQTFSNIYGLKHIGIDGKDVKLSGLYLSIGDIRTAIEKKVPYTKIQKWSNECYNGDFYGTLQEYLSNLE